MIRVITALRVILFLSSPIYTLPEISFPGRSWKVAGRTHKLSLVENSHSFMSEAIKKAIVARNDLSQCPFAVLNLVQNVQICIL